MKCLWTIFLFCTCAALPVAAQIVSPFSVKIDLAAPLQRSYGGAVQWKAGQKTALELTGRHGTYAVQTSDIFQGEMIRHYAQRSVDTFRLTSGKLLNSSGWQQFGEAQPLSPAPAHVAKSFWQMGIGCRFVFEKKRNPWSVFVQPGLSVSMHQFFEVSQTSQVEAMARDGWVEGAYPYQLDIQIRTLFFYQKREMRIRERWLVGLTYDLGVARKLGKHLFLEGRLGVGGNLSVPYEEPQPPVPVRRFWARPSLMAGWTF